MSCKSKAVPHAILFAISNNLCAKNYFQLIIEVADQGVMRDAIMVNLLLLKFFALFIVGSQCHLEELASQNQKYFKKVRSQGKSAV